MMREIGSCSGIENYSRHIDGRKPGEPPYTLLDYFPKDFLIFMDESHISVPQVHGMYEGDKSRKETLVEHGFRLPSALDNRPLRFEEFMERINQVVFVSATPAEYETKRSKQIVQQIVRPTGSGRSRGHRPADARTDRRPDRRHPRRGSRRSSGSSSPPSPRRWPRTSPTTCSRWGCACGTCTPRSTPCSGSRSSAICARVSSTSSSGSTSCERASTSPRSRSSRSSTPTRKGSCARRRR